MQRGGGSQVFNGLLRDDGAHALNLIKVKISFIKTKRQQGEAEEEAKLKKQNAKKFCCYFRS